MPFPLTVWNKAFLILASSCGGSFTAITRKGHDHRLHSTDGSCKLVVPQRAILLPEISLQSGLYCLAFTTGLLGKIFSLFQVQAYNINSQEKCPS